MTLRLGVIGVGTMGINHARVFSELGVLTGIADPDEDRGKLVAKRFNTHYFKDYQDLLRNDLDGCTISTPTNTHLNISKNVIEQNISVLVEKPLANNVHDARKIIDIAKDRNVVLSVGHIERHNPAIEYIRNSLHNGDYGKLISVSSRRVSSLPTRIKDVGVIMDLGIHDIDIARFISNGQIQDVFALGGQHSTTKSSSKAHEDHASILMHFDNGVSAFIESNWLTPMKVRRLSLTCSEKYIEVDYMNQNVEISSSMIKNLDEGNLFLVPHEYDVRQISLKKQEPLKRELIDFIKAIETNSEPLVTGEDGVEAIRIAEAALESIRSRRKIDMTTFLTNKLI